MHPHTLEEPATSADVLDRHASDRDVVLLASLEAAVPARIAAISRWSPSRRAREARQAWGNVFADMSGAADLMFGGKHAAAEFNALALVLAAFAYQPGGVTFAGIHWCTDHTQCRHADFLATRKVAP